MASPSGRIRIVAHVGVELPDHERLLPIKDPVERAACMGVWLAALCASRFREKDGFCALEWLGKYNLPDHIQRLVEVGLFAVVTKKGVDGIRVVKYDEFNETKAEIDARLKSNADRQAKHRGKKKTEAGNAEDDASPNTSRNALRDELRDGDSWRGEERRGSSLSDLVDPDPPTSVVAVSESKPTRPTTDDGAGGMAVAEWGYGVRSVTQAAAPPRLNRWDLETLATAIREHSRATDAQARIEWAGRAGAAYATANRGKRLSPPDFERWVSSGGYVAPAPAQRADGRAETEPAPPSAELVEVPDIDALLRDHVLREGSIGSDFDRIRRAG